MKPLGNRILITGASSGLGAALARRFAEPGRRLALCGRRERELEALAAVLRTQGAQTLVLVGDVSVPDLVAGHARGLAEAFGGIDTAVLNAGIAEETPAQAFDAEAAWRQFEVNVLGVTEWIAHLLPDMLKKRQGCLVAIASSAGFRGHARLSAYSAGKRALITIMDSLRLDCRGLGVDFVTICPGLIDTPMTAGSARRGMAVERAARITERLIRKRAACASFPLWRAQIIQHALAYLPGALWERLTGRG